MRVTEVTEQDGLMAASLSQTLTVSEKLLDALKLAGIPVTGPGLDKRSEAGKWLVGILHQMADQLRAQKAAAATPPPVSEQAAPMRIKAMGPMGSGTKAKKKR